MTVPIVERPFGPFERKLAMRYLGSRREHGGLALISIVSVVGITLAVWALIVTMSVMNGFRLELLSKIVGFEPHAYVLTPGLSRAEADGMADSIRKMPGVQTVEPMIVRQVLGSANGANEGIEVRGVRPDDLRSNPMVAAGVRFTRWDGVPIGQGEIETFGSDGELSHDIVIGSGLAQALGLYIGARVKLINPQGASTAFQVVPRTRTFTVKAIFNVGNERYDRFTAFIPIDQAGLFFDAEGGYQFLGVRIDEPDSVDDLVRDLGEAGITNVRDWKSTHASYVTALVVERNVMRLILFIVVIITALNIITGVLMLVKNKARDIAILRTMGATRSGVVRIFMMTGSILGMLGVLTGLVVGVLFCIFIGPIQHFLEALLNVELFPKDIYQFDAIPAKIQWSEVALVTGFSFLTTVVMAVIPSMWASRLDPVDALRFQ